MEPCFSLLNFPSKIENGVDRLGIIQITRLLIQVKYLVPVPVRHNVY